MRFHDFITILQQINLIVDRSEPGPPIEASLNLSNFQFWFQNFASCTSCHSDVL